MEERIKNLSKKIVNYSLKIKENEKVLIIYEDVKCNELVLSLIDEIVNIGGVVDTRYKDNIINNKLLELTHNNRIDLIKEKSKFDIENYDVFISIRYTKNEYESKNIKSEIRKKISEATSKYDDIRINKKRWLLLNYPSEIDAYKAKMTNREFYNYSLDVMNVDYKEMCELLKPLKKLMEKTDKVRIVSPNTDITFSIKNMPIIPCCGNYNIPDGEIYTAPIKTSVNGTITYNTPSPYHGNIFNNVSLTFENGKIIKCSSNNDNEKLEEIFNTDEGSRYIGEFSLGLNPKILDPMGDILYDEKIIGSIHFTPGNAYEDADNGNRSAIHWDMVLIQRKDYGGGEIYFDDVLIRKDGLFVLEELKKLNYNL